MIDMRDGQCALCRHNEILEVVAKARSDVNILRRLSAAYGEIGLISTEADQGELLAYVCRKCGYTQWFADDPESIALDAPGIRLLVGAPTPEAPYR